MTDIARLVLDADTRGLRNAERDLRGVDAQARRTAGEVDRASAGMASAFKRVGAALVAAGIGTVLFDFSKKTVQAAIDAEEMGSAFNVVFGKMADDVRAWAETTGNALGRSTQEIMRGALAFQELFGKSLQPEKAAEMSKQFAVLTQDLASFKNLSNEVAQQKLFAGLVGEAEPLRAVGVFLSEAAVQAKAAELGMRGVNGALTDQEKIVVRAAIIQEQLANAQGDVIRTGDSAANQIKTYNAAVEELQVAIGQKLLPQMTPIITLTAEFVGVLANAAQAINVTSNSTRDLVEGIRVISGWVSTATGAFMGFVNAMGVTGQQLSMLYERARVLLNPLSQVVSLVERIGRSERLQQNRNDLGLGTGKPNFGMLNVSAELAAIGGSVAPANSPAGLPAVAANLGKVGAAARGASADIKIVRDDFGDLYERLFPESITRRQIADLALIETYKDRFEDVFQARLRALGADGDATVSSGLLNEGPLDTSKVTGSIEEIRKSMEKNGAGIGRQTVSIAESFAQMSRQITGSLQGLANSIRSGDFLGILGGVLDIFTTLGSAGVFGSGLQGRLNATPSFDGGGYTGSGSRSGGMDGKGGFLAMMHPNETVIDHTRGQRAPANDVNITVGIDPRSGNVLAFVDGRIAATGPVIANAGAQQAQAQAARSARRSVRR